MPESFSLNDLFKIGTKQDQFRSRFDQYKDNSDFLELFSIFDKENLGDVSDAIFKAVDSDNNGEISQDEFLSIVNKFQDINQEEISDNDVKLLYQEMSNKKYPKLSPKEMYNNSIKNTEDVRETHYIDELDNSVLLYEKLIDTRQINSDIKIADLQSQIFDIVKKSANKKGVDTSKYTKLEQEAKILQSQINANNVRLQQEQRKLEEAKKEANRLEKEIKQLKSNPEENQVEIEARTFELNILQGTILRLNNGVKELVVNNKNINSELKKTNKEITKIQQNILKNDKTAESEVNSLKEKILQEKKSAETDKNNYSDEIKVLKAAREYAYNQILLNKSQNSDIRFTNSGENVPSLSGVNYSSAKGQKLAQDMKNHSVGFVGYCSRHVSNGLARTGLGTERAASAHMMDDKLENNRNFQKISVTSAEELRNLPAGCIVVYEAGAAGYNSTHGHIEVTLGDGTACSDGITRNMRYSDRMTVFVPVE